MTQKQGKYLGRFLVHMFYRLMLYGTLGLILLHYLKRKSQKYMFLSQNVEKLIIDTYEKTNKSA